MQSLSNRPDSELTRDELLTILTFIDMEFALKTGNSEMKWTGAYHSSTTLVVSLWTALLAKTFCILLRQYWWVPSLIIEALVLV